MTVPLFRPLAGLLRRLRGDARAVAMTEFAFSIPILLPLGLYGVEMSNYGLVQLRLSQATLSLADNASRVGLDTAIATQQIREVDINDVLQGFRLQTRGMDVTTRGRVTLSSLEVNADGGQWVHWQRCIGTKRGAGYDSDYAAGTGRTGRGFPGMGKATARVTAPPAASVMYVEVNYDYEPLISGFFLGDAKLQSTASFIVRDNRELPTGVSNPAPAAPVASCSRYTS